MDERVQKQTLVVGVFYYYYYYLAANSCLTTPSCGLHTQNVYNLVTSFSKTGSSLHTDS